jgi:hypothetical protein
MGLCNGGDLDPNDPDFQAAKNITEALVKAGVYAAADRPTISGNLTASLFYNVVQNNRSVGELSFEHDRAAAELSEFLTRMMEADGPVLGLTAMQAADVAARLYADTGGEIDLRSPRAALASRPALLAELIEAVIQLQKAGRQSEAPGTIVWVNTLRAELMPELRPSAKQMWSLISRRGFLYVEAEEARARLLYEQKTWYLSANIFRVVPEGFDERDA